MKGTARVILLAGIALACVQAQSQTMYRCGKVYQDRPCDAGQKGKAIGSTGVNSQAQSAGGDAQCAQRGRDSLKIVWSREGGATEERLVSEAASPAQKRFVQDVYRRRGSASEVQAAVEADCVAEKVRLEQEAALAAAAAIRALREGGLPAAPYGTQPPAPPAADPAAEARQREQRAANEAEAKKKLCAQYNAEMDGLRAQERAGGSAQTMDRLNQSRRQLRDRMSASGC